MSRAPWLIPIGAALLIAAVAWVAVGSEWTPDIPDDAASTVVARAELSGPIAPDETDEVDSETIPRSPAGSDCLPPIERPAGVMSLCWDADRDPHDADPAKDYYRLNVRATFGGEAGSGARWAILRARLVGSPADGVFETWPDGRYDGPCRQVDAPTVFETVPEAVCGRTIGTTEAPWTQRATWTCPGCFIPDQADRALTLRQLVAVPEGTVPSWELFADLGD